MFSLFKRSSKAYLCLNQPIGILKLDSIQVIYPLLKILHIAQFSFFKRAQKTNKHTETAIQLFLGKQTESFSWG